MKGSAIAEDVEMLHDISKVLPGYLKKVELMLRLDFLIKCLVHQQNKELTTELIRVNKIAELTEEVRNSSISIPRLNIENTSTQPVTACSTLSDTSF